MNTRTIPQQQDRTRDMGVSTEPHGYDRPPFAAALDALRRLEISHGTGPLVEAIRALQSDPGFDARQRGLDPDLLVRHLTNNVDASVPYVADLLVKVRSLPVAAPYPGQKAA